MNDKVANPVLIGLVLVWKLQDTYKAMFEIDSQTMAATDLSRGTAMKSSVAKKMEHKRNACAWRTNDIDIKKSNLRTTECRQGLEK